VTLEERLAESLTQFSPDRFPARSVPTREVQCTRSRNKLTAHPEIVAALPDYDRVFVERVEGVADRWPIEATLRELSKRVGGARSGKAG
jgi:hypothetical protein